MYAPSLSGLSITAVSLKKLLMAWVVFLDYVTTQATEKRPSTLSMATIAVVGPSNGLNLTGKSRYNTLTI